MKNPSKNISKSLRSQRPSSLNPQKPMVGKVKRGGVSMTVPGEGMVETAPGAMEHPRSAAHYADAMSKKVR